MIPGKDNQYPVNITVDQVETQHFIDGDVVDELDLETVAISKIEYETPFNTTAMSSIGYNLTKKPGPVSHDWKYSLTIDLGYSMPVGYVTDELVRGMVDIRVIFQMNPGGGRIRQIPNDDKFFQDIVTAGLKKLAISIVQAWPIAGDHPYVTNAQLTKRILVRFVGSVLADAVPSITHSMTFWFTVDDQFPTKMNIDIRPRVVGKITWESETFGKGKPIKKGEGATGSSSSSEDGGSDFELL